MPPDITALGRKTTGQIAILDPIETVLSFRDADVLGASLQECGFTQRERVRFLVNTIRNADVKEALKAERALDALIRDTLDINGFVATLKEVRPNADGSQHEIVARQIAAQRNFRSRLHRTPNGAAPQARLPDSVEAVPGPGHAVVPHPAVADREEVRVSSGPRPPDPPPRDSAP